MVIPLNPSQPQWFPQANSAEVIAAMTLLAQGSFVLAAP